MDFRDNLYPKMPFYMTYPMQNMYLTEMEYEKDMERMKSYFPEETRAIQHMVEERLDELEFEGSRIYDEEPDRLMMQMEIDRIYHKLLDDLQEMPDSGDLSKGKESSSYFDMVPMSISGERRRGPGRDCRDGWLCSMVSVLFGTELYRRRCRHRRCRRWW